MRRATVIIGSNWGDEGKGLITDYIANKTSGSPTVVVRFNGGAQAGHTVVTPDANHIFSHFSSGTFAYAHTYFAKQFVCNPLLFWKEAHTMRDATSFTPMVAADPRCYITTPYDMVINQELEIKRGKGRHGSVGVGFGETIERNQYPAFRLNKSDLKDKDRVRETLKLIRDRWLPTRCQQLQIDRPNENPSLKEELLEMTVDAFRAFDRAVSTSGLEFLDNKTIIFEGAQGLALDMNSENFPHVTRSNTGLTNVVPIALAMNLSLEVIYVTRAYLTKHGAGPLPGEQPPWDDRMIDNTNVPHPFQGVLRYAKLDITAMQQRIRKDIQLLPPGSTHSIAVTCCDQVNEADQVLTYLKARYYSCGDTREHVVDRK